jgi:hypothetical protein
MIAGATITGATITGVTIAVDGEPLGMAVIVEAGEGIGARSAAADWSDVLSLIAGEDVGIFCPRLGRSGGLRHSQVAI